MLSFVLQAVLTLSPASPIVVTEPHTRVVMLARQDAAAPTRRARGQLGVGLLEDRKPGLRISTVTPGSAAERAGLAVGDRILSLDGSPTDTFERVAERIQERAPGTEVRLRIRRALEAELVADRRTEDGRFALGVRLADAGAEGTSGLEISDVVADGSARVAGVLVGDRIAAIGDTEVGSYAALVSRMREIRDPGRISITVERDLEVRLGGANDVLGQQIPDRSGELDRQGFFLGTPRLPTRPAPPRRVTPDSAPTPSDPAVRAQLQDELHQLAQELQALRRELAELRNELRDIRPRRSTR